MSCVAASTKTSSPGSMRVVPSHSDLVVGAALVGAVDRDEAHLDAGHQLRQLGDDVAAPSGRR